MNINTLFPRRFATGEDIADKTPTLPIARVTLERMGPEQKQKPVLWFNGARKGIVLGAALARQIAALHGDDTDAWVGKAVQLYTETVRAFGEAHLAIRARAPQAKPAPAQPAPIQPSSLILHPSSFPLHPSPAPLRLRNPAVRVPCIHQD